MATLKQLEAKLDKLLKAKDAAFIKYRDEIAEVKDQIAKAKETAGG